jgi:hypothetical protein
MTIFGLFDEEYLIYENNEFRSPQSYLPAFLDDIDSLIIHETDDDLSNSLIDNKSKLPLDPETGKPIDLGDIKEIPDNVQIPGQEEDDLSEDDDKYIDNPEENLGPDLANLDTDQKDKIDPIEFVPLKKYDLLLRLSDLKNELKDSEIFSEDLESILKFGKILKYDTLLILSKNLIEQLKNQINFEKNNNGK